MIRSSSGNHRLERRTDRRDLPRSAGSTRTGEDRASAGNDGGILDEGGIGESLIGRKPHEGEPQALQGPAVGVVLLQCERQVGRAETGGGEAVGEGGAGGRTRAWVKGMAMGYGLWAMRSHPERSEELGLGPVRVALAISGYTLASRP